MRVTGFRFTTAGIAVITVGIALVMCRHREVPVEKAVGDGRHTAAGALSQGSVRESSAEIVAPAIRSAGESRDSAEAAAGFREASPEEAEERQVSGFDAETDRWIDASRSANPSVKDVDAYVKRFRALPGSRKEECLHRALNLIPDENVMLLVGILMDKAEDRALIQLVYNDILNRGEDVKKTILKTIFADREHPCWADTAWILDVTGELPDGK